MRRQRRNSDGDWHDTRYIYNGYGDAVCVLPPMLDERSYSTAAQSNATATAARYRFGAKEHETMHGLNAYDFGPRLLSASLPVWDCPDRQQERYHPLSPYTYCAANPIRYADPSGEEIQLNAEQHLLDETQIILQGMVGDLASVNIADGKVSLQANNDARGTEQEKNALDYLLRMTNSNILISFELVEDDPNVIIADGISSKIDMADVRKLGNDEPGNPAGILIHEFIEQYCIRRSKHSDDEIKTKYFAHLNAISAENQIYTEAHRDVGPGPDFTESDGVWTLKIIYHNKGDKNGTSRKKEIRFSP